MSLEWFYLQQWKRNRYLREEAEKKKKADEGKENTVTTAPPESQHIGAGGRSNSGCHNTKDK